MAKDIMQYKTELEIIAFGAILTTVLWWLFGGIGFWSLPGLIVLFIGFAEIINKVLVAKDLRVGLIVLFVGLASYLSFGMHVVLGVLQLLSIAVIALGLIILAKEFISAPKTDSQKASEPSETEEPAETSEPKETSESGS